jgi:hypothetical protein
MKKLIALLSSLAVAASVYSQSITLDSEWDTSAEIAANVSDETGSGALVFGTGAELINAELGLDVATASNLTANVNDYTPTGFTDNSIIPLTTDGSSYDITGLTATRDGDIKILHNRNAAAGGVILLDSENASSTAANRFKGGDYYISEGAFVMIYYSSSDSRWIVSGRALEANDLAISPTTGELYIVREIPFSMTIYDPDGIQGTSDALPILPIETDWAPNGITLKSLWLKTDASSTYSVNFELWTSPTDGTPSTIETVATSASTEATDDGTLTTSDGAVGSIIFVDLPATAANWISVGGTYTIDR